MSSQNKPQSKPSKEESMLKSYNETFYTSLKSLQFLSNPLPREQKLLYHFEQNESAAVSSTIGQLESALDDLIFKNEQIKKTMKDLKNEIKDLKDQINDDNKGGDSEEYAPQVKILQDALNDFIEKQKVENFRLKEEIALLEKEKAEVQQSIYDALGYLNKLEKVVGIKSKTYTYYYDQTLSENEFASKFIIKDENI
jgi:predicted  nucleic acid-binding Zn-ribbon protein